MNSAALFDLLPDFGASLHRITATPVEPQKAPAYQPSPVDVDALIAQAVAKAEAALEARLTKKHQAALEAEREENAAEAKAFLESLGGDVGNRIAERISSLEERLNEVIGASVARMVGRILGDELTKRSLDALANSIRISINDREAVRVSVRGPQSLFEELRASLGAHADQLDFVEAPGFDLTVTVDNAVVETRIGEWADTLGEILP